MGSSPSQKELIQKKEENEEEEVMEDKKEERKDEIVKKYAAPIPESLSEKLYNSIIKINLNINEKKIITGTGFFIKLKLKNKIKHFLITCHHVIEENFVKEKKVITFYYGKVNKEKSAIQSITTWSQPLTACMPKAKMEKPSII